MTLTIDPIRKSAPHTMALMHRPRFAATVVSEPITVSFSLDDTATDLIALPRPQAEAATPSKDLKKSSDPKPKRRLRLPKWATLLGLALMMFVPDKYSISRMTGLGAAESKQPTVMASTVSGSSGGSLPPVPIKTTNSLPTVPLEGQGPTYACGTTSLSIAINSAKQQRTVDRHVLDNDVRRADTYTTPEAIVAAAKHQGINAEIYNYGSFEALKENIDKGNPIIVLTKPDPDISFSAHYQVVVGYNELPDGRKEIELADPGGRTGIKYKKDFNQFDKEWRQIHYAHLNPGFHRLMIVVSNDPLPPSNYSYTPLSTAATNVASIIHTGYSLITFDVKTLLGKDITNGSLLMFALAVAGAANLIIPNRAKKKQADDKSDPKKPTPEGASQSTPVRRPVLQFEPLQLT